jgi:hypothetical protein
MPRILKPLAGNGLRSRPDANWSAFSFIRRDYILHFVETANDVAWGQALSQPGQPLGQIPALVVRLREWIDVLGGTSSI